MKSIPLGTYVQDRCIFVLSEDLRRYGHPALVVNEPDLKGTGKRTLTKQECEELADVARHCIAVSLQTGKITPIMSPAMARDYLDREWYLIK